MEFALRKDQPIYLQVAQTLADAIVRGELGPGERLPSQRDVASQARVNPNTIQRAYSELEHWGFTESKRGEGTFVKLQKNQIETLKKQAAKDAWQVFFRALQAAGFTNDEIRAWTAKEIGMEDN